MICHLDELCEIVRDGSDSILNHRLNQLSNSLEYLTSLLWYDGEHVTLLMLAALHGHDHIVRLLLSFSDPKDQIELKGQFKISDQEYVSGATALYCACYRQHFHVAKILIQVGHADVNQFTCQHQYYPLLLHATMKNRIDIIQFLIENKYSNVNLTKTIDNRKYTSLMLAVMNEYIPIVEYLIKNGADVNYIANSRHNRTALDCAFYHINFECIRILFYAKIACINGNDKLINEFLENFEIQVVSRTNLHSNMNRLQNSVEILKLPLEQRQSMNIRSNSTEPLLIYNLQQQCQTLDQFNSIRNDRDRIIIEILLICERLFSSRKNIDLLSCLIDYGNILIERNLFEKCFDLWIHIYQLYQETDATFRFDSFIWIFCKMLQQKQRISIDRFLQICRLSMKSLIRTVQSLTIYDVLCYIVIASEILKQDGLTINEKQQIYNLINEFCQYQFVTENDETLLHLCIDKRTYGFFSWSLMDVNEYFRFPNESVLRLLIECGKRWINVNAIESSEGNTAFHIVCKNGENLNIINLILDFGCHVDCVNFSGKTPIDYVKNEQMKILIQSKSNRSLNLKCLCARYIVRQHLNININQFFTRNLSDFIILHGGDYLKSINM